MNNIIELSSEFTRSTFTVEFLLGGIYKVDADHEQEAVDIIIDYWEKDKHRFRGYFHSDEELSSLEFEEEYVSGGNCGTITTFQNHEMRITECN